MKLDPEAVAAGAKAAYDALPRDAYVGIYKDDVDYAKSDEAGDFVLGLTTIDGKIDLNVMVRAAITAYLDALLESGRAKACHAWVSDSEGIFDADFEPIEGTVPAIIILDGDA